MAPEQLRAFLDPSRWGEVGIAADIFSLGLILRELLTGERPAPADPAVPVARAIHTLYDERLSRLPSPRTRDSAVPHALCAILDRCLAPRPEDRYAHALDLAEDLRRFINRLPLRDTPNPSLREAAWNWGWRHRRWGLALVVIGAIAVVNTIIARHTTHISAEEHLDLGAKAVHARNLAEAQGQYQKAIDLDPSLFTAYLGLGYVDLIQEKYEASIQHYTEAIALAEGPPRRAWGERLASPYYSRAEAAIDWGTAVLNRVHAPLRLAPAASSPERVAALAEAEALFASARADLDRARAVSSDARTVAACEMLESRLESGFGDLAIRKDQLDVSRSFFEQARRHGLDVLTRIPADLEARRLMANIEISLGHVDQFQSKFEQAYLHQARAVAIAEAPPRIFEGAARARVYYCRAEASLYWGDELQRAEHDATARLEAKNEQAATPPLPTHNDAEKHYREALADIVLARGMSNDAKTRIACGLIAGRAECGLGDLASRRDRYADSCAQYDRAEREMSQVLSLSPGHRDAATYLGEIRTRLKTDQTELEKTRENVAHRR
jgi:tetratricopeptide (TPR) repeat protein